MKCTLSNTRKPKGKALIKSFITIFSEEDWFQAETLIETLFNHSFQQFLNYKHTYEKQNNHVILKI